MEGTVVLTTSERITAEAISRLERRGFSLVGIKLTRASAALAAQHYSARVADRDFRELVSAMAGQRVTAMAWEGDGVVAAARALVGEGDAPAAASLAGTFGLARTDGAAGAPLLHASADAAQGQRELCLWFSATELIRDAPPATPDADINFAVAAANAAAVSADPSAAAAKTQQRARVETLSDKVRGARVGVVGARGAGG